MNRRTWIARSGMLYTSMMLGPFLGIATPPDHQATATSGKLRLNANENPYGCSPEVLKVFESSKSEINRYAFPSISQLKENFANHFGLSEKHVLIGPGSSYLLESVGQFMLQKEGDMTSPTPTFDILPAYLERFGRTIHRIALKKDHTLDLDRMKVAAEKNPGMVYIVNPNNPIGTAVNPGELKRFVEEVTDHSYAVVDEAYLEFSDANTSLVDLVSENPKVIVLKTMSKIYGMAGLRIGYGLAHPDTVAEIEKLQVFPGVFTATASFAAAAAGLKDQAHLSFVKQKNEEAKKLVYRTLDSLGIYYIPSQTSFVLFDLSNFRGDFMDIMAKQNILIGTRDYLDKKWCRVSMGTLEETQQFTRTLTSIWS